MNLFNPAIGSDRPHTIAAQHAAAVIPPQPANLPAFLSMPKWTVEETATYLRCEPQTIRKALSTQNHFHGLRPSCRFGRRWYFSASEVRSMLEAA
jgi:hypothetical protein